MDKEKILTSYIAMVDTIYNTSEWVNISMVSAKLKLLLKEELEEVRVLKKAAEEINLQHLTKD